MYDPTVKNGAGPLVIAFCLSLIFILSLCVLFDPMWETNDDIHMSMSAHGYGVMVQGSPNLVYSNVLWGKFVRAVPQIFGFTGYTVATIATLIFLATVLMYSLVLIGYGYLLGSVVVLLLLVRLTVFPQYTMTAGILALAAVLAWQVYARMNSRPALFLACAAAFVGYLLRSQEFYLVLFVALPIIPWGTLRSDRPMQIAILALGVGIAIAVFSDYRAYHSSEWLAFNEFEHIVRPFVDFGGAAHLSERPDILSHYGYSRNDILLFGDWFFIDPKITNVEALRGMLSEIGPFYLRSDALSHGWQGLTTLSHRRLWVPVMAALLLAIIKPSRQVALSWILFLIAIFVLGLMGRPGVLRVYVPLVSVLIVAPLLFGSVTEKRRRILVGLLVLACMAQVAKITSEYRWSKNWSGKIQSGLAHLPNKKIVVWAGFFPYEAVYPVLQKISDIHKWQLYSLDFHTLAPNALSWVEEKQKKGMITELMGPAGVPVVADGPSISLLNQYCIEHLGAPLRELSSRRYTDITNDYGEIVVRTLTCSSEKG